MVSAGGQDAWVLKRAWNAESSQELSLQRLKSREGMRRGTRRRGPPGWYQTAKQLRTAWGLGNETLFWIIIIPHPWQSFPVFCLPKDREREGCIGRNDVAQLSRPTLHYPPPLRC